MLLNILQAQDSSTTENYLVQNVISAKTEKPWSPGIKIRFKKKGEKKVVSRKIGGYVDGGWMDRKC